MSNLRTVIIASRGVVSMTLQLMFRRSRLTTRHHASNIAGVRLSIRSLILTPPTDARIAHSDATQHERARPAGIGLVYIKREHLAIDVHIIPIEV